MLEADYLSCCWQLIDIYCCFFDVGAWGDTIVVKKWDHPQSAFTPPPLEQGWFVCCYLERVDIMDCDALVVLVKNGVYPLLASWRTLKSDAAIRSGMTVACFACWLSCFNGNLTLLVACIIDPLAALTIMLVGPICLRPCPDWIKLLVVPESIMACLIAC